MSDEPQAPTPDDDAIRHSEAWQAIKKAKPFLPDDEITALAKIAIAKG